MMYLYLFVGSMLLGALPFGAWIARLRGVDITKQGSGNIGATNVHRVLGKGLGFLVLMLDFSKGLLPVLAGLSLQRSVGGAIAEDGIGAIAGLCAVFGHCFSPFLRFKGGKGIATGCGAVFGLSTGAGLVALSTFIVVLSLSRYVSLASILAAITIPISLFFLGNSNLAVGAAAVMTAIAIWRHSQNIHRLLNRSERRFSLKGGAK